MQAREIYILSRDQEPKDRIKSKQFFTSEKALLREFEQHSPRQSGSKAVAYKIRCNSDREYNNLLNALEDGRTINLTSYKEDASYTTLSPGTKEPHYRPLIEGFKAERKRREEQKQAKREKETSSLDVYILSNDSNPKAETSPTHFFTSERALLGEIAGLTIHKDFKVIAYKITCNNQREYNNLLDNLKDGLAIRVANYEDTTSYATFTSENTRSPRYRPLAEAFKSPKQTVANIYNDKRFKGQKKSFNQYLKEALSGKNIDSAKYILQSKSHVAPDVLTKIILNNQTDIDFYDNVDNWLRDNHNQSLFSLAKRNGKIAMSFLGSSFASYFSADQIGEIAAKYPKAFKAAEQKSELSSHVKLGIAAYRKKIGILENNPPADAVSFADPVKDIKKAEHYLRLADINSETNTIAMVIAQHGNSRNFLDNLDEIMGSKKVLYNIAMQSADAAIELLKNNDIALYLRPSELMEITFQHRSNDKYQRALLGFDSKLSEAASLHAILERSRAGKYTKEEKATVVNLFNKSSNLQHLFFEENLSKEREKSKSAAIEFDPYQILGVSRDADEKEIKEAYEKAKNFKDKVSPNEFKQIQEAYDLLSDRKLREIYDEEHMEGPSLGQLN